MSSARSRRMQGSIGSSWDDGDLASEEDASIYTASGSDVDRDFGVSDKESDQEYTDKATPLLSRGSRASLPQRYETPTNTPSKATARHSQTGSSRSTPRSTKSARSTHMSAEPSFIMPRASTNGSLSGLMDDYATSTPTRNSQLRVRKQRPLSRDSPTSKASSRRSSKHVRPAEQQDKELDPWYARAFFQNVLIPIVHYFLDISKYAFHLIKPLAGLAMGVGVLYLAIMIASGFVHSRISTALAPLCIIPGSSYIIPICATPQEGRAQFEELMNVQGRFEDILDTSKDTSDLPHEIKNSELAIRDLRTLVKYSHLPSRAQLDVEFEFFVQTAKEASTDLLRYNSRIGSVLGRVINTNLWTHAVLAGLQEGEASTGVVGRTFQSITGSFIGPPRTLEQRIFDQYILHVGKNKEEIASLIKDAQELLRVLTNMDERLDTIFQLAVNDDQTITRNHDELLSQLWTKLGGNQASKRSNVKSLALLREVSSYRKRALKHVSQTLIKLQEMQSELENLYDDVSAPEVLGWRSPIPLTYHMGLIEESVERLKKVRGESMRIDDESKRRRTAGIDGHGVKELPAVTSTVSVKL